MTTARDLAIVALDGAADRPVEQGELSLALAGAEVLDLVAARAVVLDGERLVPGGRSLTGDGLLDEAASALVREEPYEPVGDWLWRRGRGLSASYTDELERTGLAVARRGRRGALRTGRTELVESAARREARERWAAAEPVLAALAAAAGLREEPSAEVTDGTAESVVTVLVAVGTAVQELQAVRQRRVIEDAAFDNIWRGF
ncbi:GPP34 family phosphoprotein [Streptomyces sp. NPDC016845]|uniref:GPP34 family phosphoprotein n=1 Tax=Streptomyces sp. NPDC016845 TaxID=3364972 RepID=UPI0037A95718